MTEKRKTKRVPTVGPERTILLPHDGECSIDDARITPDGRLIVYGGEDAVVRVWDVELDRVVAVVKKEGTHVGRLAITPDGRYAVFAEGSATYWDLEKSRKLARLRGHTGYVCCAAITANGGMMATGADNGEIFLWKRGSGKPIMRLEGLCEQVECLAFTKDETRLLSGGWEPGIRVWDVRTGDCLSVVGNRCVHEMVVSADGQRVATRPCGWLTRVWNMDNGCCFRKFMAELSCIVALSPDGRTVVTGSDKDWTLRLWDISSKKCLVRFKGHTEPPGLAGVLPDGRMVTFDSDGVLFFWLPMSTFAPSRRT